MSYTVTQMITDAFYEAVIVARGAKALIRENLSTGLQYFNEVLGRTLIDVDIVPFYKEYTFNLLEGVESYEVPYLIDIKTFDFFINGNVRYPLVKSDFNEYWGSPKATNVETLPAIYLDQRILGGSKVSVTPDPSQTYPAVIWGLFGLQEASLNDDLLEIYDIYYITYLRALLDRALCIAYGYEVPMTVTTTLMDYDRLIRKRSAPLDLKTNVINTMNKSYTLSNGSFNLYNGYVPTRGSW